MSYYVIKRYGHEEGLSVAFRQWKATDSHCRFVHGYSLAFEFKFKCRDLDARNWCYDFGSLKRLKQWLKDNFDHKFLVASDDPYLNCIRAARDLGILDMRIVPQISCERFAEMAFDYAFLLLSESTDTDRVKLVSVKVCEHAGNAAIYEQD